MLIAPHDIRAKRLWKWPVQQRYHLQMSFPFPCHKNNTTLYLPLFCIMSKVSCESTMSSLPSHFTHHPVWLPTQFQSQMSAWPNQTPGFQILGLTSGSIPPPQQGVKKMVMCMSPLKDYQTCLKSYWKTKNWDTKGWTDVPGCKSQQWHVKFKETSSGCSLPAVHIVQPARPFL